MTRDRTAALTGITAGTLGILAGLITTVWGAELGSWAGDKQDPVPLGLLTIVLAATALAVSTGQLQARPALPPGRRAAVAAGQLLPGLIGFTTVGPLWWIPGTALVLAGATTVSPAPRATARAVRDRWPAVLTSMLGVFLVLSAAGGGIRWLALGTVSGALVAVAPWIRTSRRPLAPVLLVVGALPFAALTWWTLVTPLTAALALIAGTVALHGHAGSFPSGRPRE
ncbi:hypothetical protein [Streptomyces sp. S.PB5]|uniref:hypothetical protein n=1 Tax=Streptomyces sp. S.PB5 TaxID=3020844 RepID=UPI0025B20742|nr:hypothetical protein [Streptomyces sp. S.PB5]MDN3027196.1 hypothetical protein [Streptomyces sp. S.PB5]